MLGATLALVVGFVGFAPAPDPVDLVNQLGSPRYALRESAESDLVRLGRAALPALRDSKDSKDPEIRARVSAILASIENSLLLESTPVALDFRDIPLSEAIERINRQTGLKLTLSVEETPDLADRRLTVESKGSLPFWKAIDALCAGGGLHHVPGSPASSGALEGLFTLHDGNNPSTGPISDCGPFRVHLSSIHLQSEIQLGEPRPIPIARGNPPGTSQDAGRSATPRNRQFFLQFQVTAEPRLSVTQNGPVKLTTVVDDRNQSLLGPPGSGGFQHNAGYFGINASASLRLRADLQYPASPGEQIRLLRGTIPVVVATRRPDPAVLSLAGSVGRSIRVDEVAFTLLDYRPAQGNVPATIQVALKPLGQAHGVMNGGIGEPSGYRADPIQQLEILDAGGRPLSWFPSRASYNGDESRLTLTVGTGAIPATLRYYGILRASSEFAFEFRDIPIP